jgi:hypothetical protein
MMRIRPAALAAAAIAIVALSAGCSSAPASPGTSSGGTGGAAATILSLSAKFSWPGFNEYFYTSPWALSIRPS